MRRRVSPVTQCPRTERVWAGEVVPIPTFPVFKILKSVVVAEAVLEATAKSAVLVSPLNAWIESLANGVVVPMPRRPLLSSRMPSESEVPPFLVENVSAEVVPDTEVRMDEIRAVEVASPEPDSFINNSPEPMPSEAEDEAICDTVRTSTTEEELLSVIEAEREGIEESDVVAKVLKVPGPWE